MGGWPEGPGPAAPAASSHPHRRPPPLPSRAELALPPPAQAEVEGGLQRAPCTADKQRKCQQDKPLAAPLSLPPADLASRVTPDLARTKQLPERSRPGSTSRRDTRVQPEGYVQGGGHRQAPGSLQLGSAQAPGRALASCDQYRKVPGPEAHLGPGAGPSPPFCWPSPPFVASFCCPVSELTLVWVSGAQSSLPWNGQLLRVWC